MAIPLVIIPTGKSAKLKQTDTIQLDGNGNGEIEFGPVPAGREWMVARLQVFVDVDNPMPVASVYDGTPVVPNLVDATYTGAQDTSEMAGTPPMSASEVLTVRWTGGAPGANATATLTGVEVVAGAGL